MTTQTTIIAGVFEQESQARRALDALKQAGFRSDQVGVAVQGQQKIDLENDLLGWDVPRAQATYYAQEFQQGRTVISVRPDGQEQAAHDLLHQYGGYDYEHQTVQTQATTQDASAQTAASDLQDEFQQPRSLTLRAERLNVSKQSVQSGEVKLHKEVITEQKTVDVPVTHEEIVIERRAISDGRIDSTPIGEGETIRIPVSEEQVNVTKKTVETGEVAVGKRTIEETQKVSDTVKHEEARTDQKGNVTIQGNDDLQKQ